MKSTITVAIVIASLLASGCSTRQEGSNFRGSTEQRLVTYSINQLSQSVAKLEIAEITGKKLFIRSHFVIKNEVVEYAQQRLEVELAEKFDVKIRANGEDADYRLDVFYTSLGTDRDALGLSVPVVNLSDPEQSAVINILAVDMYHGLAEANLFLTNLKTGEVVPKSLVKSRIRSDKFSTPFFSIPLSNID